MKAAELRDLGADELGAKERDLTDQLFRMRIQKSMGQLEAPDKMRTVRRDLARVKTVLQTEESRVRSSWLRNQKKSASSSATRCRRASSSPSSGRCGTGSTARPSGGRRSSWCTTRRTRRRSATRSPSSRRGR